MSNGNYRLPGLTPGPSPAAAALFGSPNGHQQGYEMFMPPTKCTIWLDKTGTRFFDSVEEAALFLLCNENVSLLRFCRFAVEEKAKLMSNLGGVPEEDVWKYLQLRDATTSVIEEKLSLTESPAEASPPAKSADAGSSTASAGGSSSPGRRSPRRPQSSQLTPETAGKEEEQQGTPQGVAVTSEVDVSSKQQLNNSPLAALSSRIASPEVETETAGAQSSSSRRRGSYTEDIHSSQDPVAESAIGGKGRKGGRRRVNVKGMKAMNGVDVSLAQSMSINFECGGELVTFSDVKNWRSPTTPELIDLRSRIVNEWMEPFSLKQQDIVRATGVGAPYICYLFRDPDNPNMTTRRRVEAFCVLSELMRKFDDREVTKQDFIKLRDARVERRYLKRHGRTDASASASVTHISAHPEHVSEHTALAPQSKRIKKEEGPAVGIEPPSSNLSQETEPASGDSAAQGAEMTDDSGGESGGDEEDEDDDEAFLDPRVALVGDFNAQVAMDSNIPQKIST
eukprot:Gregarina_sp_Poly_1__1281@NODE_1311_length_4417_cov_168_776782_g887_i0_p1_GENE_NODE_1311_length_4417_cov_168_776782_g887_i0NODE_1311_length_4417_cov_168_776782_g887_i0_p1_ORF_typecomplete_len509_score96_60HNF1_N/PF04814_13/0_091HNF1_N/PF04814_13/2e03_NODE_1311_length_4417_cov_168_776782_g887_i0881614